MSDAKISHQNITDSKIIVKRILFYSFDIILKFD